MPTSLYLSSLASGTGTSGEFLLSGGTTISSGSASVSTGAGSGTNIPYGITFMSAPFVNGYFFSNAPYTFTFFGLQTSTATNTGLVITVGGVSTSTTSAEFSTSSSLRTVTGTLNTTISAGNRLGFTMLCVNVGGAMQASRTSQISWSGSDSFITFSNETFKTIDIQDYNQAYYGSNRYYG